MVPCYPQHVSQLLPSARIDLHVDLDTVRMYSQRNTKTLVLGPTRAVEPASPHSSILRRQLRIPSVPSQEVHTQAGLTRLICKSQECRLGLQAQGNFTDFGNILEAPSNVMSLICSSANRRLYLVRHKGEVDTYGSKLTLGASVIINRSLRYNTGRQIELQ